MVSQAHQVLNALICPFTVLVARCWVRCRKLRYPISVIGESCSRVRRRCSSCSYQARKLSMALLYRRTIPVRHLLSRMPYVSSSRFFACFCFFICFFVLLAVYHTDDVEREQ